MVKALHGELQMKSLSSTAVQINNTGRGFVKFCGCPTLCRRENIKPKCWLAQAKADDFCPLLFELRFSHLEEETA